MRNELRELVTRLNITALYVTHDQVEALSMSDRLIVMSEGEIVQEGSPAEVYIRPTSEFSANFLGRANILRGTAKEIRGPGQGVVETTGGALECLVPEWAETGSGVLVTFRPESVMVRAEAMSGPNVLRGVVQSVTFVGDSVEYVILVGDVEIRAKGDPFEASDRETEVWLRIPPGRCLVIKDSTAPSPVAA
jgi:iron(III) transport system ATP-binding protein